MICLAPELSLGIIRLAIFVWDPRLKFIIWRLRFGNFRLGSLVWVLSLGIVRLGTFTCDHSCENVRSEFCRLYVFACELSFWDTSLDRYHMRSVAWELSLEALAWDASLGSVRVETLAWECSLRIFRVEPIVWGLRLGWDILFLRGANRNLCWRIG